MLIPDEVKDIPVLVVSRVQLLVIVDIFVDVVNGTEAVLHNVVVVTAIAFIVVEILVVDEMDLAICIKIEIEVYDQKFAI